MFEQEILTQLKTKYKNLGLSETILKAKAKQLSKAVEKQEDIENAVAGVEDDLAIFQSFADQNRTLAKEIADLKKEKGAANPEPTPNPNPEPANPNPAPTGEPEPAWAKAIREQMEKQNQLISGFQAEKTAQTNAQKLQSKLDELQVSKSYLDILPQSPTERTFQSDEEIEAFAASLKAKSDAYEQSLRTV
ncbi:hypothetical protein [Chryseobacterium lathyri]|uniref:hypothetical protein n=1 Tax=Chryseobacterium lathyri TaxID=395933 RepID=UPI001CBAA011|nr:hypothetical protein [Chryseobacterium lathyri]